MNKYMGFYELNDINIPTIPWNQFTIDTVLDNRLLWTLRVAVEKSNDLNLPRMVGVNAEEAYENGMELLAKYKDRGMVIYYPYFIAKKSGVIDISSKTIVIEAVDKDLWNLVTHGNKDVTIIVDKHHTNYIGDKTFLSQDEIASLLKNANIIKSTYRDLISEGKSIFAEWSFAYNTNVYHKPIGEKYLIFFELRSVN